MDNQKVSTKKEVVHQQKPFKQFSDVMIEWLAMFSEHYRQPISKLSALAFSIGLSGLSAEQLDAACREVLRTSEYMPIAATIRIALKKLENIEVDNVSGLDWNEALEQERIERKKVFDKLVAEGKEKPYQPPEPQKQKLKIVQPTRTLEEQKAELRKRGLLP